jgi:hypothetical protein
MYIAYDNRRVFQDYYVKIVHLLKGPALVDVLYQPSANSQLVDTCKLPAI